MTSRLYSDELLAELRGSEEWRYVDRDVEIRLLRA